MEIAVVRAREIASRSARDQGRFRLFFGKDFGQMLDLESSFSDMVEQLSSTESADRLKVLTGIGNRVHEANRTLSAIYGRLRSGQAEGQV